MPLTSSDNFMRFVLWAGAISCLACGLLQVSLTTVLSERLGLPATLLADTGIGRWLASLFYSTACRSSQCSAKATSCCRRQLSRYSPSCSTPACATIKVPTTSGQSIPIMLISSAKSK